METILANKLLIVGKFPPIHGGVSTQTYWTCLELSEKGFHVDVLTNANEVELNFRQFVSDQELKNSLPLNVKVYNLELIDHEQIPNSASFVTRLVGLGIDLINSNQYDAIIGWYLEPYGVAASILGQISNLPVILIHAGSDIGKLSKNTNLASFFVRMINNSHSLLTNFKIDGSINEDLARIGVSTIKCYQKGNSRLPNPFFQKSNLNLIELINGLSEWYKLIQKDFPNYPFFDTKRVESGIFPTIGIVGKIGTTKGSFALLEALNDLALEGIEFNFFHFYGGNAMTIKRYLNTLMDFPELISKTFLLPFLPPWKMPGLYQALDITCFLEYNFPIFYHNPVVPREAMASGSCLVLSEEIAEKQVYTHSLVDSKNYFLCKNPNNKEELKNILKIAILKKKETKMIGKYGMFLSKFSEKEFFEEKGLVNSILNSLSTHNNPISVSSVVT